MKKQQEAVTDKSALEWMFIHAPEPILWHVMRRLSAEREGADVPDLLQRCAQDLREYADAAEEAGESIEATEGLLSEVDACLGKEWGLVQRDQRALSMSGS